MMRVEIPMVVDCDTCPVRGTRCDDCVVTAVRHLPVAVLSDGELPLDAAEQRAVDRFVEVGLVTADGAGTLVARREPWPRETTRRTAGTQRAVG